MTNVTAPPSIASPEQVLCALLLQAFYSISSERQLTSGSTSTCRSAGSWALASMIWSGITRRWCSSSSPRSRWSGTRWSLTKLPATRRWPVIAQLRRLRGIGPETATVLAREVVYRDFANKAGR
jgi:hypothetical protein